MLLRYEVVWLAWGGVEANRSRARYGVGLRSRYEHREREIVWSRYEQREREIVWSRYEQRERDCLATGVLGSDNWLRRGAIGRPR